MKQQEKTHRTQARILEAAAAEFGENGYEAASINAICAKSQVPKGLLYHNFRGKDDLFLRCVALCYEELTDYLRDGVWDCPRVDAKALLALRQTFFAGHPHLSGLFFRALLQPPAHLRPQLKAARREFDALCMELYRRTLEGLELRDGVTEEQALDYFALCMELFNDHFQARAEEGGDYRSLQQDHEEKLLSTLDMMLYGIAKQP